MKGIWRQHRNIVSGKVERVRPRFGFPVLKSDIGALRHDVNFSFKASRCVFQRRHVHRSQDISWTNPPPVLLTLGQSRWITNETSLRGSQVYNEKLAAESEVRSQKWPKRGVKKSRRCDVSGDERLGRFQRKFVPWEPSGGIDSGKKERLGVYFVFYRITRRNETGGDLYGVENRHSVA